MDAADFLGELMDLFPKRFPNADMEARWHSRTCRALQRFSSETLEKAASDIGETRTNHYFPTLAELVKACEEVERHLASVRRVAQMSDELKRRLYSGLDTLWDPKREEKADGAICCEMGKIAASEGWINALWDFHYKHGRLPQVDREIETCRHTHAGFEDDMLFLQGQVGPFFAAMRELGESMVRKGRRRAQMVGGVFQIEGPVVGAIEHQPHVEPHADEPVPF